MKGEEANTLSLCSNKIMQYTELTNVIGLEIFALSISAFIVLINVLYSNNSAKRSPLYIANRSLALYFPLNIVAIFMTMAYEILAGTRSLMPLLILPFAVLSLIGLKLTDRILENLTKLFAIFMQCQNHLVKLGYTREHSVRLVRLMRDAFSGLEEEEKVEKLNSIVRNCKAQQFFAYCLEEIDANGSGFRKLSAEDRNELIKMAEVVKNKNLL